MATRQLYVDGVLSISITGDSGPYSLANNLCLAFGAKDWDGGTGGNFYAWTKCKMDDVRIYDAPLSAAEVQALAAQETGTMILYPQWMETMPGQKTTFSVTLVPQALQSGSVTVWVTNSNPAFGDAPGRGGQRAETHLRPGFHQRADFPSGQHCPRHSESDVRGFGRRFGQCGGYAGGYATAAGDGGPLDLQRCGQSVCRDIRLSASGHPRRHRAGDGGDLDRHTAGDDREFPGPDARGLSADHQHEYLVMAGTMPTFDDVLASQMTIAFWVKVTQQMSSWDPFIVKDGESAGFQVRFQGADPVGCFTVRGTDGPGDVGGGVNINDGQWHHIAAVRNGTDRFADDVCGWLP